MISADLQNQITDTLATIRQLERAAGALESTRKRLDTERARLVEAKAKLAIEGRDVERLEGISLAGLLASLRGEKEQRLDQERTELLQAKAQYDRAERMVRDLEREIEDLEREISNLSNLKDRLTRLLAEKERLLRAENDPLVKTLNELDERASQYQLEARELQEALAAGKAAQAGLDEVFNTLSSAANWGTFDLLGGGLLASIVKHDRIGSAQETIHALNPLLARFQRELSDLGNEPELSVPVTQLDTFLDFFFDGLIVDWMVQNKINEARLQTETLALKLQQVMAKLEGRHNANYAQQQAVEDERARLLR
jgi:hypothetical protein